MTIPATAAAIAAAIKACTAACTIALTPGTYPGFIIQGAAPTVPVTIDATGSTFTSQMSIGKISNITWQGGVMQGARFLVEDASAITVDNVACVGPPGVCIMVYEDSNVIVNGGWVTGSTGDGVDVFGSSNVTVEYFSCMNPASTGTIHPDCVQVGAIPAATVGGTNYPANNITVQYNTLLAPAGGYGSQGFDVWNHGDPTLVNDVQIIGNTASTPPNNCLALLGVTNGVAKDNVCITQPGEAGTATWKTSPYVTLGPGSTITDTTLIDTRTP
jgi:hypothetical protein